MIKTNLSFETVSKCLQEATHRFPLLEKGLLSFHVPKDILYGKKKGKKNGKKSNVTFQAKDITSCSGCDRHYSPKSDGSYGSKYVLTDHGDYAKLFHAIFFAFIRHHNPDFEVHYISNEQPGPSKPFSDKQKPPIMEHAYDMKKVIDHLGTEFISKSRELLTDFINGCMKKSNLFKTDSKRTATKIFASGMQLQEAEQVKHHRRFADLSNTEPFTNTNSNQMHDEDCLGLKFAELQVITALVNKINLPSIEFNEAYKLPDELPETKKNTIYNLRLKNFEALIGPTLFDGPASPFLKKNTKTLRALMTGKEEENLNISSVRDCFKILKFYLPCAGAVRAVDFCWRHSDPLGENSLCPVTQAMILSISLNDIEDKKARESLRLQTSDPEKECIQFMVALYGRGCTENYADIVHNEVMQMKNNEIDLLTKIIVKLLTVSKGTDLDHQASIESDISWEQQCASRRERESLSREKQVLNEELAKRSFAPKNTCIRKCNTLCRFVSNLCLFLFDLSTLFI